MSASVGVQGPAGTDGTGIVTTAVAVGIGTTNTDVKLHVSGGKDTRIRLEDPTQAWSWSVGWDTQGDFSLIQEGVKGDRIYVAQNGNVGLGTSSPDNRLDVSGVIRGQSESEFGDVLIVGNDSKIVDVNVLHTMGIYSNTDSTQGHVQLGSGGPKLSGINGRFGVGTGNPQATLDVAGNFAINGVQVINSARQWVGDPTGLTGPQGPSGPQGPQGGSGTSSWWMALRSSLPGMPWA